MTLYVGENVLVTHTATKDGVALTDDDVSDVGLTIWTIGEEPEVVLETPMVWNETATRWEYNWDTDDPDVTAGTYRARVKITHSGRESWEFQRIRLRSNPVE